ncbi:methyltransferase domain-containing protein [uncultured Eubacterium sp.]|uniref:class I SAM-dependent DNA methyltransferase n=1 Tax=uncultured Eubacterium sp. TaxID=165185 RepID=UPI0028056B73|nr:methyltransferase domain-containing protein [uncultured Eubacterium sp.]
MSSYQTFAYLYDELTQNVEYEKRCDYILSFFEKNGIKSGTVLDLACGTGSMSIPFMKRGYNIIGLDYSEEMLEIASNRFFEAGNNFSLLKAKMQEFELSEKADACICCLDSINHLNNIDDVQAAFKNVYDSLNNNGLFVFDVNTVYKHNEVLADNTFVFDEDDYYLVWDNEAVDDRTVRILLDMFLFNGENYDRFSEEFEETAYSVEELSTLLKNSGFVDIKVYDELSYDEPKNDSERLYFVCKKV